MACTSTKPTVLGCKIPHELDALKWKAIGRGRRDLFNNAFNSSDYTVLNGGISE
jgi:hypothetical protein